MDFYEIVENELKNGTIEVFPDWIIGRSTDLMVRGRSFYAVWDQAAGIWKTDEYEVQRLVDEDLRQYVTEQSARTGRAYKVKNLKSFNTQIWISFRKFMQNVSDNSHQLDEKLIFADTKVKKSDYASRRLSYSLEEGRCDAWNELMGVLYSDEERAKIEWAIGAIVCGDSKRIQKFLVLYGPAGSGKSTVLNIIAKLFDGYVASFDAKALTSSNNAFSTEVFKSNPLVAIQHDGDLSKIEDNTKLNSIISHEYLSMNEKYKPLFSARVNAFLFMGTNQVVRITDAKSGIIRRLIDVHPTGNLIENGYYFELMDQIDNEFGAIAYQCLTKYREMGKNFYGSYRPIRMMFSTDIFYNFIEAYFDIFKKQDGVTLKQAYEFYKLFCAETGIDKPIPQYKFREELKNYFNEFEDKTEVNGVAVRSYYNGFRSLTPPSPFKPQEEIIAYFIDLKEQSSLFDALYPDQPAQYSKDSGFPGRKWELVKTTLSDIDTTRLHFVKIPENHIVIDFDLVDENGEKDLNLNLVAATEWPATYSELSKSGAGLHLHYFYNGDVHELSSVYDTGIEIKTLLGDSALRRKLTRCNDVEIATLNDGTLPKKEKSMIDSKSIQSEKKLREMIAKNLRKEYHPGTKPSVDFIYKILEDAYNDGLKYDVQDLRPKILSFAASSTNQAMTCIKTVQKMKFVSEEAMKEISDISDKPIVFFDVEVYPNLFVVCWKYQGDSAVVRMVNPEPNDIEPLFALKLVGFNNRDYDNHILYARYLNRSIEELFKLSQRIIVDKDRNAKIGEAYNLSYADIYEFSSKKQGLKAFEIDLGITHMELDFPYDQPIPKEKWGQVVEYCVNDVVATEAVFEDRKQDFVARQILSELSGLPINHTTQNHAAKIIFGNDKKPQSQFTYTDLSKEFPGYQYIQYGEDNHPHNIYRGEDVGFGGYVYAEPGVYENVAVLDIASQHPTSIIILNLFGDTYTPKFKDLLDARIAIKRKNYDEARTMLDGRLAPYLENIENSDALAYALKIVVNSCYGLTSATFPNSFKDQRNVNNIVALRGALTMVDLRDAVKAKGFIVAHIKTDSIKIPNATPEIIEFVMNFGKKYGYDFEHEATYDKFALVNDAVYIAKEGGKWVAVGAQFAHPYVMKTLFTNEEVVFDDYCEKKHVNVGTMYLNFNDISIDPPILSELTHVGKTNSFVPVKTGGVMWRVKGDKFFHVTGTKGHLWITREMAIHRENLDIDMSYFEKLQDDAFKAINKYGVFEEFVS